MPSDRTFGLFFFPIAFSISQFPLACSSAGAEHPADRMSFSLQDRYTRHLIVGYDFKLLLYLSILNLKSALFATATSRYILSG